MSEARSQADKTTDRAKRALDERQRIDREMRAGDAAMFGGRR